MFSISTNLVNQDTCTWIEMCKRENKYNSTTMYVLFEQIYTHMK